MVQDVIEEEGREHVAVNDLKALGQEIQSFSEMGMTRALWEPQPTNHFLSLDILRTTFLHWLKNNKCFDA